MQQGFFGGKRGGFGVRGCLSSKGRISPPDLLAADLCPHPAGNLWDLVCCFHLSPGTTLKRPLSPQILKKNNEAYIFI